MQTNTVSPDVAKAVQKWQKKPGSLIMALHEIQSRYGYVPREVSMEVAQLMNVPLARIYEVLTFYNYFRIDPPGKHNVSVCLGTACYLKGSAMVQTALSKTLDLGKDGTTADRQFHVESVRCVGCCGLAPVVVIDGVTHGKVTPAAIVSKIEDIQKAQAAQ
ncbi:MAG: NAD(P)H-dependent oxidoreductase subunit E [Polyangiaceae bacterium]|jgi:NADH-quinone oxidoreductase subunit E